MSVSILSSISLDSNDLESHSFNSSAAREIICFLFVSLTSLISTNLISASQGPTRETVSIVAANNAVSFRVNEDGILILPPETPSFDSFSTSILPIRPDF